MNIRNINGFELQEAKEACTDALLNLTYAQISGRGDSGEYVIGERPSRKFVSGHLLPQFDTTGVDDETNDIHISTLGMDFQVISGKEGLLTIQPKFSVYLRVLPTWDDMESYAINPLPQLSNAVERSIRDEITSDTNSTWAAEKLKPEGQRLSKATIRINASIEVYRRWGIFISNSEALPELFEGGSSGDEGKIEVETTPESDEKELEEEKPILTIKTLITNIPDALAKPAEIPNKWKRFFINPSPLAIPILATENTLQPIIEEYGRSIWDLIFETVSGWISTTEGQAWTYREARVLPSHVASSQSWEAFLQQVRSVQPAINDVVPKLSQIRVVCTRTPSFSEPCITNIRVSLENRNNAPEKREYPYQDNAIFQTDLTVKFPVSIHSRLRLERVQPSYRFRNFMFYPALGINCGVEEQVCDDNMVELRTNWQPRYIQPRIIPRDIPGVPWRYAELSDEATDIDKLYTLINEYTVWIEQQELIDPASYEPDKEKQHEERQEFNSDIAFFRNECALIKRGIDLLKESQAAYRVDCHSREAFPYRAWLLLNRAMLLGGEGKGIEGWRLFQEAFIIAHLPTIVSRMVEFSTWHNWQFDEEMASLLYFSTGGGKSEAFYGLIVFNLFFDRLRGKNRGVTALIRYPLRLLTLQQAQRFFELISFAERVKHQERISGAPFEIGFWVGSANTPNRNDALELKGIIDFNDEQPLPGDNNYDVYHLLNETYNKIPTCPYCGYETDLRRCAFEANRLAIVCSNSDCDWNRINNGKTPLPFLLTDDDIYAHAPAIILGTIDKLALIGQHDSTINKVVGMFGLGRFMDNNGRIVMPRQAQTIREAIADSRMTELAPAFDNGFEVFHDPFPSLIIQDEAHLLDESLGTFTGFFETTLEQLFRSIATLLGHRVARNAAGVPRMPKIIAATATISTPRRQMDALYQRNYLHFPHPGTSIYESFYSHPAKAPNSDRQTEIDDARVEEKERKYELCSPWMRVYASIMTNGRLHTVTTVTILGSFHVTLTKLWHIAISNPASAINMLKAALSLGFLRVYHEAALDKLTTDPETLLGLLDLYRISLTYVTNKKGGDQVIEALTSESEKLHKSAGIPLQHLRTELISGGVDVKQIQEIMTEANQAAEADNLQKALRNIVATSAISHGVDVDRFNAMFFAGMPTDIAEYIQASSRIGRLHVGFSCLIPVPQKRRDRYIVEVHDIFHRFLERMIAPAAIERWAANALKRIMPSLLQSWLNGYLEQKLFIEATDKSSFIQLDNTFNINRIIKSIGRDKCFDLLKDYILSATGVWGRGIHEIGKPNNQDYYVSVILNELTQIFEDIITRSSTPTKMPDFWTSSIISLKPMTSLRDIDEAGRIIAGKYLPERIGRGLKHPKNPEAILKATKFVRKQRAEFSESDED